MAQSKNIFTNIPPQMKAGHEAQSQSNHDSSTGLPAWYTWTDPEIFAGRSLAATDDIRPAPSRTTSVVKPEPSNQDYQIISKNLKEKANTRSIRSALSKQESDEELKIRLITIK